MHLGRIREEFLLLSDSVLHSYSIVFFSQNQWLAALLLAATMMAPQFGLTGLAGLLLAFFVARLIGFDREKIRNGTVLFNSLLVSLALAYLQNYQPISRPSFLILMGMSSVITLFVSVFLNDIIWRKYAFSAMSFPFVWVAFSLFFLYFSFSYTPVVSLPPVYLIQEPCWMPQVAVGFFQALGAIFFLPHSGVGILIFTGLLCWSRLSILYGVIGYSAGISFMKMLGMDVVPSAITFAGFNYIFCAIALGGIFFVPSRSSAVLAMMGACFCVAIAVAGKTLLQFFGIPPLALPLNIVILLIVYAMRLRPSQHHSISPTATPGRPEDNFIKHYTDSLRFPDFQLPHLHLPFFGERTVTQGVDGMHTHRGHWREALDFEILDEAGNRFDASPETLENSYVYDTPVLSPCNGVVATVVNNVPDNELGTINTDRNWGNTLIILADSGVYVKLSHFKTGSLNCIEGQRIITGEVVGKCGNSGRSPVPHLHMQAQHSSILGDHSIPFRISQYLSLQGNEKHYFSSGIPAENETVFPAIFDEQVGGCFEFGDQTFQYEINGRIETIECRINEAGEYVFKSQQSRSTLRARIYDHTFYVLDFNGVKASVLFYFRLALSRVPFLRDDKVVWTDAFDLRPMLTRRAAITYTTIGPFWKYPLGNIRSRILRPNEAIAAIHSVVSVPVPRSRLRCAGSIKLTAYLDSHGIQRIEVEEAGAHFSILRSNLS